MILYLDTSALVMRYFREAHTDDILSKWIGAKQIFTSSVAYAETVAALYRKKREANLDEPLIRNIVALFSQEWVSFVRVKVNDDLNATISHLVQTYPLRGFDVIHLASAMAILSGFPRNLYSAASTMSFFKPPEPKEWKCFLKLIYEVKPMLISVR